MHQTTDNKQFDVIIIGGSYAGLSAAMALGRSLRKVLIIDHGKPCNRYTPHSHNFITHDGAVPAAIAQKAKEQVLQYDTVTFLAGEALSARVLEQGFEIGMQDGTLLSAKKLIFATGVQDIFPDLEGFEACWGKTIIHCPYCHGYEFRGKQTAIWADGDRALHLAGLVHNLSKDISIISQDKAVLKQEQLEKLQKHQVPVIDKAVTSIVHENGAVRKLVFEDGSEENFDAVYAAIPFRQQTALPEVLGCSLTETGHIKVDTFQKTAVPGIYACGDNSSMMRSVANAVYTGNLAGAMVNHELTQEVF
ncbi:MAG: NAD(P)/FAD-dependent oxidoreductase [Sphingobacteriales bacterium]|nr:MAG: NAD(P)/FAD-dependent oxidoreductase [Sphingobacteriales bacterium]